MFIPNTYGLLRRAGSMNLYGEQQFLPPVKVPCGVVRLAAGAEASSVRADTSASRGSAEEMISDAKILFPISVGIAVNDAFEIHGIKLRVIKIEPRLAVTGEHDHNEVDFVTWSDEE